MYGLIFVLFKATQKLDKTEFYPKMNRKFKLPLKGIKLNFKWRNSSNSFMILHYALRD